MSWREMIEASRVYPPLRRDGDSVPCIASLSVRNTEQGRMGEYTFQDAYKLTLKVENVWYANQAEYPTALRHAEREVAEYLFGDVRARLHRLRSAVYQRNTQEAMRLIDEIDEATKP